MSPPPALSLDDPRHPRFDPRYAGVDAASLPAAESLKDTLSRVLPYWESRHRARTFEPTRNVLVVAHGNSLRALVKMLDMMSEARPSWISNIPTGIPIVYELDEQLQSLGRRFLGDPEAISAAQEAVRRPNLRKKMRLPARRAAAVRARHHESGAMATLRPDQRLGLKSTWHDQTRGGPRGNPVIP